MNNQIRQFALYCVNKYATYDKLDDFYSLDVSDIPPFIKNKFAALIMETDPAYANEATGADNPLWESYMLPSLLSNLKDNSDNLNDVWKYAVTQYFIRYMQEAIDEVLYEFNSNHGYTKTHEQIYGVRAHGSI